MHDVKKSPEKEIDRWMNMQGCQKSKKLNLEI